MNSAFLGYEEVSRSRRVFNPPWPLASEDNTLLNLLNSSYPTQPHSLIANYSPFIYWSFEMALKELEPIPFTPGF